MQKQALALPNALLQSVKEQRVVLFLGAGASMEARDAAGRKPPSAAQLSNEIALKFFGQAMDDYDLPSLAELAIQAHGDALVFDFIREQLLPYQPSAAHRKLPSFMWRAIATTNYDLLVDTAYSEDRKRRQTLIPFVKDREPVEERMRRTTNPLPYLKLHGCLNHITDPEIPLILSHEHYARYSKHRTRLFDRLRDYAYESTFVFCGYRVGDAHIRNLIYQLAEERVKRPRYYLVDPGINDVDQTFWMSWNVELINGGFADFVSALDASIPSHARAIVLPDQAQAHPIARHFRSNVSMSEALLKSLANDLTHVHPLMSVDAQDAKKFYYGFDTGWGAIAQNLDVHRDEVDDLLTEAVLAAPTSSDLQFHLLSGAAGSGKSVALKRTAWNAAADFDVLALWQREGGFLSFDVLSELHALSGKRIFLFVDRVASQAEVIEQICATAKVRNVPLTLVCAERSNEWKVYCDKLEEAHSPEEIEIGKLGGREIDGLLDLLEKHGALGLLAGKKRDEQTQAFADRADRQLLVALHEATLGKPFEEIVLDEYRAIVPEEARQLYLAICTMHQYGEPARAGTISRISGIRFDDYKSRFLEPLKNVVKATYHPNTNDMHYHARHTRIAQLVFKQACANDDMRTEQLSKIVEALDVGYSSDRKVLEEITRGHKLVETLNEVGSGRRIYREALRASADSAFIYQQWAIFEANHPQGSLEEADRLAREAIDRDPKVRSFKHTHANICRKRALEATSPSARESLRRIARQRLDEMRAEADNYVLSMRAGLAIDELSELAEQMGDAPEDTAIRIFQEKVREVEMLLARARQRHPDDPDIAQCEARLSTVLNQHARAVRALERAWNNVPRGSGVAIRLAHHYAQQRQPERTLQFLMSALERNQDDRHAHLELAKHYVATGTGSREGINQHFMRSYTANDNNFEAQHLHAQYLFLIGRHVEARSLFEAIDMRAPTDFRRRIPKEQSIISEKLPPGRGVVVTMKAAMAFISIPAYPADIFAHASASKPETWRTLRTGDAVAFELRFNRSGPVAVDVRHV